MCDNSNKDELAIEIERKQFIRAALLASSLCLPEPEVKNIQFKALGHMAAEYRNALGTKKLAQEYGISINELKDYLEHYTEEKVNEGDDKLHQPCYDIKTGRHFSFEELL